MTTPTDPLAPALPPIRNPSAIPAAITNATNAPNTQPLTPKQTKMQRARLHRGPSGPREGRTVDLVWKKEQIGEELYELLLSLWRRHMPLKRMLATINPRRIASNKDPMTLVDLYATLFAARQEKLIQQRKEPVSEMSLEDFSKFYNQWKSGANLQACIECVAPYKNGYFCKLLFAAISAGYRAHRTRILGSKQKEVETATTKNLEISFLKHGVRRIIEGASCIVIPIQSIPKHLLALCQSLPVGGALFVEEPVPKPYLDQMPLGGSPVDGIDSGVVTMPILDVSHVRENPETMAALENAELRSAPAGEPQPDSPESFEERFDDQDLDALFGSPSETETPVASPESPESPSANPNPFE